MKDIYKNHSSSLSIDETLFLLVNIYKSIEEEEIAKNYAAILAYNFPESKWYKKSYKVFNKDYVEFEPNKVDKNKKGIIDKFRKLFD